MLDCRVTATTAGGGATGRARTAGLWAVVVLVLLAANLRPAIVAVSPLLSEIRADTGLTASAAGLLTTVPVLCFGLFSVVVPGLARRFGLEPVLVGAMLLLVAGFALRLLHGLVPLFAGTALVGVAIAIGNVLLPAIIKRDFRHRVGIMTGVYSMALSGGAALAAGLTIPLARAAGIDWRPALAAWGLFAVLALLASATRLRRRVRPTVTLAVVVPNLWRSGLAWWVTLFFGLQSLVFYAMIAWLPAYLIDHGHTAVDAGWMLSLFNLLGIAGALLVPIIAGRLARQSVLAVVITALALAGVAGLLVAPALASLWVAVFGFAQGGSLATALLLVVLRAPDSAHTSELSGMAQGVGYTLAALGPFALGALHDLSGSWALPLLLLVVVLLIQAAFGYAAGTNEHVRMAD